MTDTIANEFVSDYKLGKLSNQMAYIVTEKHDLPKYLVKARGKSGRLSKRIFASIKALTNGNVPQVVLDALFKDKQLQTPFAIKVMSTVKLDDLKPKAVIKSQPKPVQEVAKKAVIAKKDLSLKEKHEFIKLLKELDLDDLD
jgi:hypothetical protein|tara:strand:+ start:140 stop:565 length:426 start_codon:yes stop_codon:yes gene_type:complete